MDLFLRISSSPKFYFAFRCKKTSNFFWSDPTMFGYAFLALFKNIFALYVNFSKSSNLCVLQLRRRTLKSRLRKYITCWGFLHAFCRKLSIYSKYNQYFQICGYVIYMENFQQHARRKPQHVIYFRNLLFSVRLLSYRKNTKIGQL